jgi:hypothetical protein
MGTAAFFFPALSLTEVRRMGFPLLIAHRFGA